MRRATEAAGRALPDASGPGRVLRTTDKLERFSGADRIVRQVQRLVRAAPLGRARDALHGRWLGHPVHPLMVQVPIGSWMSAAVLDTMPGQRRAARTLIATGIVAALPAAVAGWVDWAELHRQQMRVGLVHAAANVAALGLYTGSLTARLRGREALGRLLALGGLSAVGVGGALGGHLAYRQASGANHAEFVPHLVTPGWHKVADLAGLPEGRPVRGEVDGVAVAVVRDASGSVHVLADRCSHMGGPLSQGTVVDGCLRCPWHGSAFRLSDGWNVRGPATAPQPSFDTRVVDGRVEARLRFSDVP
ncbi:Rieske (2Fe-2S) protein [Streptomyces sp. NPDC046831]|uniref:Rieske (2Fe-2S) protein n=1 Tax=Streptomyces sp. NPDC046831 TaxID=3154805 RepID=UPI0033FE9683